MRYNVFGREFSPDPDKGHFSERNNRPKKEYIDRDWKRLRFLSAQLLLVVLLFFSIRIIHIIVVNIIIIIIIGESLLNLTQQQ